MAVGPVTRSTLLSGATVWRGALLLAAALLFAGGGYLWTRTHRGDVLPVEAAPAAARSLADVPLVAPENLRVTKPEISDTEKEKRRFERLDKDASSAISRDEYLVSRVRSFERLDTNGDGKVSLDEYSARAVKKFAEADGNDDGKLSTAEFATTAPKHRAKPKPNCPPAEPERSEPEG